MYNELKQIIEDTKIFDSVIISEYDTIIADIKKFPVCIIQPGTSEFEIDLSCSVQKANCQILIAQYYANLQEIITGNKFVSGIIELENKMINIISGNRNLNKKVDKLVDMRIEAGFLSDLKPFVVGRKFYLSYLRRI